MDKVKSALEKYEDIITKTEARLGELRALRYQNILKNFQHFQQLDQQNSDLNAKLKAWQASAIPMTKPS